MFLGALASLAPLAIQAAPGIIGGVSDIVRAAKGRQEEDLGWGSIARTAIRTAPDLINAGANAYRASKGRQQQDLGRYFTNGNWNGMEDLGFSLGGSFGPVSLGGSWGLEQQQALKLLRTSVSPSVVDSAPSRVASPLAWNSKMRILEEVTLITSTTQSTGPNPSPDPLRTRATS